MNISFYEQNEDEARQELIRWGKDLFDEDYDDEELINKVEDYIKRDLMD